MSAKRLLVVDDMPDLGEAVGFLANALGYEYLVTTHGRDFMREFERFKPDAVVLDMVMPEIDGIELVQWLKERNCTAKVLVASGVNSAHAMNAEAIGSECGLDITRLSKPFVFDELCTALTQPQFTDVPKSTVVARADNPLAG